MRIQRLLAALTVIASGMALASCGGDSTGPVAQNPTLVTTATPSGTTMFAGDSLILTLDASDSTPRKIPLEYTEVSVQGALTYSDSVSADSAYHVHRTVRLRIPNGPLATHQLNYSISVVAQNIRIEANSFIINVVDTTTASTRRVRSAGARN